MVDYRSAGAAKVLLLGPAKGCMALPENLPGCRCVKLLCLLTGRRTCSGHGSQAIRACAPLLSTARPRAPSLRQRRLFDAANTCRAGEGRGNSAPLKSGEGQGLGSRSRTVHGTPRSSRGLWCDRMQGVPAEVSSRSLPRTPWQQSVNGRPLIRCHRAVRPSMTGATRTTQVQLLWS